MSEKRKLTYTEALKIRKLHKDGLSYIKLGKIYGMARQSIEVLCNNKTYNYEDQTFFGERNGNVKLTEEQVLQIRNLYETGNITMKSLSEQFGIHTSCISKIINRTTWSFL